MVMRLLLLAPFLWLAAPSLAVAAQVFITSGTTTTIPADWNNTNTVECIGAGGSGSAGTTTVGGSGGGSAAWASVSNFLAAPGEVVSIQVATGGSEGDTQFYRSTYLLCKPGLNASGVTGGGGVIIGNSVGTSKFVGATGAGSLSRPGGAGGAGSAGPTGAGKNGQAGGSTSGTGGGAGGSNGGSATAGNLGGTTVGGIGGFGTAGNGACTGATSSADASIPTLGAGGCGGYFAVNSHELGSRGACDAAWDATHGACGGGGGGGGLSSLSAGGAGGAGGTYGAGGGGGGAGNPTPGTGTVGGQGLIVLTYTATTAAQRLRPLGLLGVGG